MSWRNAATFSRLVGYNLLGFATWLPVVIYFNEHVAETATINGHSMHPFFNTEKDSSLTRDRVLNWKWEAQEGLERGMIVTFM